MKSSSSMKVATQLGLAFGAVVVMLLIVAGMAAMRMSQLNDATQDIATNWLPSVRVLGDMRSNINRSRMQESAMLLARDDQERIQAQQKLAEYRAALEKLYPVYEPLISSPEERQHYEQFRKHLEEWRAVRSRVMDLARAGSKGLDESKDVYRGESSAAFDAVVKELIVLVDINDKGSVVASKTAGDTYASGKGWLTTIAATAVLLAIVLALWIVRSITRQLGGEPAEAATLAQRVADGDLSAPIAVRQGDTSSLLAALKRMQDSLSGIVNGVRNNADGVATASAQIAQGNNDLSSRTEEQASALQQTAASMKELASTVQQNAQNAEQGNQLALEASTVASRGGEVVGRVVETMKGINDSSRKIADIISVIDGIAFQTNILALNAAVEAARAGEQGRGFAVVAGEVRTLAQRSADAAKEIKGLITASVERVEQGSALVDQAGATMSEVVQSIRRVTDLMTEISSASNQQSAGVAQIGEAVNQMDQATQQNAALVEESAAAADSLKTQAGQLVGAVSIFKTAGSPPSVGQVLAGPSPVMTPVVPGAHGAIRKVGKLPAKPPVLARQAVPAAKPAATAAGSDDDWQSF